MDRESEGMRDEGQGKLGVGNKLEMQYFRTWDERRREEVTDSISAYGDDPWPPAACPCFYPHQLWWFDSLIIIIMQAMLQGEKA